MELSTSRNKSLTKFMELEFRTCINSNNGSDDEPDTSSDDGIHEMYPGEPKDKKKRALKLQQETEKKKER